MPWPPKRWRRPLRRWLRVTSLVLVIGGNAFLLPGDASSAERRARRGGISHASNVEWSVLGWTPAWPGKSRRVGSHGEDAWDLNYRGVLALRSVGREPERFFEALGLFKQAVDLDPRFKEASYNYALALDLCSLRYQALKAWDRFLDLKPGGSRAREARERKEALLAPTDEEVWLAEEKKLREEIAAGERPDFDAVVSPNREAARKAVEERLLPEWAGLYLAGKRMAAERLLELATGIADSLARVTGDQLLAEAVAQLGRTRASHDGRLDVARGLEAYGRGLALYQSDRYGEAEAPLETSRGMLAARGSAMEGWAAFRLAQCLLLRQDFDRSLAIVTDLQATAAERSFPGLGAYSALHEGTILVVESRPGEALGAFERSLQGYRSLGEPINAASAHLRIASALSRLARPREGREHLLRAILGLHRTNDLRVERAVLGEGARTVLSEMKLPEVALTFRDELGELFKRRGQLSDQLSGRRQRAAVLVRTGRQEEALQELARVEDGIGALADAGLRETFRTEVLQSRIEVLRQDAQYGPALLDEAIRRAERTPYRFYLAGLYLERGRVRESSGDLAGAEADYLASIRAREDERTGIARTQDRLVHLDINTEPYDALSSLLVRNDHPIEALAVTDRSRGRSITDELGVELGDLEDLAGARDAILRLARSLPREVVVLIYRGDPASQELGVWVVRRTGIVYRPLPAKQEDIEAASRRFQSSAGSEGKSASGEPFGGTAQQALFKNLLAPIMPLIPPGRILAIVPAGRLWSVPWSALQESASGPTLLERNPILLAPSLTVLTARSGEPVARFDANSRVLHIGASQPDPALYPRPAPLPAAREEGVALGLLYREAQTENGATATKSTLLADLPQAEIFAFSGHTRAVSADPLGAALVLAQDGGEPGSSLLTGGEILNLGLPNLKLAILAACSSGRGAPSQTEGFRSLALGFLARGVRQVVATNWKVEDDVARDFSLAFHAELVRGTPPLLATQKAKLSLFRSADPRKTLPREWAAFELMGSL